MLRVKCTFHPCFYHHRSSFSSHLSHERSQECFAVVLVDKMKAHCVTLHPDSPEETTPPAAFLDRRLYCIWGCSICPKKRYFTSPNTIARAHKYLAKECAAWSLVSKWAFSIMFISQRPARPHCNHTRDSRTGHNNGVGSNLIIVFTR